MPSKGAKVVLLAAAVAVAVPAPGKPALLDFWASWCSDCREELANVEAEYQSHGPKGLDVVGVLVEDEEKPAEKFARAHGVTYRLVSDDDKSLFYKYHVRAIPTLILLDAKGVEQGRWLGYDPKAQPQIDAAVNRIMNEWVPPKSGKSPKPGAGG